MELRRTECASLITVATDLVLERKKKMYAYKKDKTVANGIFYNRVHANAAAGVGKNELSVEFKS